MIRSSLDTGDNPPVPHRTPPFCYASTPPSQPHIVVFHWRRKLNISIYEASNVFFTSSKLPSKQDTGLAYSGLSFSTASCRWNKRGSKGSSSPSCPQNGGDQRQRALPSAWEHTLWSVIAWPPFGLVVSNKVLCSCSHTSQRCSMGTKSSFWRRLLIRGILLRFYFKNLPHNNLHNTMGEDGVWVLISLDHHVLRPGDTDK